MSSTRTTFELPQDAHPDALTVIRARTHKLHTQLEARFDLPYALSSGARYRTLLRLYFGLYSSLEAVIAAQSLPVLELIHWSERRRVPLLERDLYALGATAGEIQNVQRCSALPDLTCLDSLLGALYVMEGSCLGGQIICREIKTALNLDRHSGAAFFFGDGEGTGRAWKQFTSVLKEHVSVPERAADTACAMFSLFDNWLFEPNQKVE